MITKIVFLDIDGVLNSQLYYESGRNPRKNDPRDQVRNPLPMKFEPVVRTERETIDSMKKDLDPVAISFLNELVAKAEASVVITSTWRMGHPIPQIRQAMTEQGFVGKILGGTPCCGPDTIRGNEIHKWMKEHEDLMGCPYFEYNQYIILDDDSDVLYWHRNNFLLVDGYVGLTPNLVYKADYILTRKYRT